MYKFRKSINESIVTESIVESKAIARNLLNQSVKESKEQDKNLVTYYTENSNWYSFKILCNKSDVDKFDNGEEVNNISFEIIEIEEED